MKKYLTFPNVIRLGLACVFLTSSLEAFLEPSEFQELISGSFFAGILSAVGVSVSAFVSFISFNDLAVAVLLVLGWRTSLVATYAAAWVTGVIFVIGVVTLDALEHLAFIAMALSLALRGKSD